MSNPLDQHFECEWCDYKSFNDKRHMGLHVQYNHPEHFEEWLQIYEDNVTSKMDHPEDIVFEKVWRKKK